MSLPRLPESLDRSWRVFATGLSFLLFGVGGFLLGAVVLVPVLLFSRDPARREVRVLGTIQSAFRLYLLILRGLRLMTWRVEGAERLANLRGQVVVANHPTLLDVVALGSLVPQLQCVVKRALWSNALLRVIVQRAGYIPNDLDPEAFVARCVDTLHAGNNLLIFPEGTRTAPGAPFKAHRGFAAVAMAAPADVLALHITCDPPTLRRGEPWYRIPPRAPAYTVRVATTLATADYLGRPHRSLGARHLAADLEQHYINAPICSKISEAVDPPHRPAEP